MAHMMEIARLCLGKIPPPDYRTPENREGKRAPFSFFGWSLGSLGIFGFSGCIVASGFIAMKQHATTTLHPSSRNARESSLVASHGKGGYEFILSCFVIVGGEFIAIQKITSGIIGIPAPPGCLANGFAYVNFNEFVVIQGCGYRNYNVR